MEDESGEKECGTERRARMGLHGFSSGTNLSETELTQ
jgi:hypothetical protein